MIKTLTIGGLAEGAKNCFTYCLYSVLFAETFYHKKIQIQEIEQLTDYFYEIVKDEQGKKKIERIQIQIALIQCKIKYIIEKLLLNKNFKPKNNLTIVLYEMGRVITFSGEREDKRLIVVIKAHAFLSDDRFFDLQWNSKLLTKQNKK